MFFCPYKNVNERSIRGLVLIDNKINGSVVSNKYVRVGRFTM